MLEIGDYVIVNTPNPDFRLYGRIAKITGVTTAGLYTINLRISSLIGDNEYPESYFIKIPRGATIDQIAALWNILK